MHDIQMTKEGLVVPDYPTIPFIKGDGIGPEIWEQAQRIFDQAVFLTYQEKKKIQWQEVLAGQRAFDETGSYLPQETLDIIKKQLVSIKGPLTTPIGEGIRSINVALRQTLDLYVCMRPVRYFKGVPSPVNVISSVER